MLVTTYRGFEIHEKELPGDVDKFTVKFGSPLYVTNSYDTKREAKKAIDEFLFTFAQEK